MDFQILSGLVMKMQPLFGPECSVVNERQQYHTTHSRYRPAFEAPVRAKLLTPSGTSPGQNKQSTAWTEYPNVTKLIVKQPGPGHKSNAEFWSIPSTTVAGKLGRPQVVRKKEAKTFLFDGRQSRKPYVTWT